MKGLEPSTNEPPQLGQPERKGDSFRSRATQVAVTSVLMKTYEVESEHDACPNCGSRVESAISAPGDEPLREATERRCPNCGVVLRREIGGEWAIDETAS